MFERNKGSPASVSFKAPCMAPHVMYSNPREIALYVQEFPEEEAFTRRHVLLFRVLEVTGSYPGEVEIMKCVPEYAVVACKQMKRIYDENIFDPLLTTGFKGDPH
jgi:hypothetical protein